MPSNAKRKPPEATGEGSAPIPVDDEIAAVRGALEALQVERETAENALRAARERQPEALVAGDDVAVDALESQEKRAARNLRRLALTEEILRNRLSELISLSRAGRLALARGGVKEAATQFVAAALEAVRMRKQLIEALASMVESGFEREVAEAQMAPPLLFDGELIERFDREIQHVDSPSRSVAPASDVDLFPVRLLVTMGALQGGAVGGFRAADAWRLVRLGKGEWADPARVPPEPAPTVHELPTPRPGEDGKLAVLFVRHTEVGPRSAPGYRPGETAAFEASLAEKIVRSGAAVFVGGAS